MEKPCKITLQLNNAKELFSVKEIDPFNPENIFTSGIEYIQKELKAFPEKEKVSLHLIWKEEISGDEKEKLKRVLKEYSNYKINALKDLKQGRRKEGISAFFKGLIFLVSCLLLAYFFKKQQSLSDLTRFVTSEGLIVIGWVSVWKPVEILLYEQWSYNREIKLYNKIKEMEVTIN